MTPDLWGNFPRGPNVETSRQPAGGAEYGGRQNRPNWLIPLGYLFALVLAESMTTLLVPQAGMILHFLLLMALLLYSSLFARGAQAKFLLTLALAPLIRLLSLAMPLPDYPLIYWYVVVGVPLFLAAFLAARIIGLNPAEIGFNAHALPLQLAVGLTGIGMGYVEYLILRPDPLIAAPTWDQVWLPALILLVFTGLLEEVIFRGVMQRTSLESLGHAGVLYVAVIFAVLHLGYHSALDMIFVFAVAIFFGVVVARTGSILGVALAHGLMNITLFLIFPFTLKAPSPLSSVQPIPFSTAVPALTTTPTWNFEMLPLMPPTTILFPELPLNKLLPAMLHPLSLRSRAAHQRHMNARPFFVLRVIKVDGNPFQPHSSNLHLTRTSNSTDTSFGSSNLSSPNLVRRRGRWRVV